MKSVSSAFLRLALRLSFFCEVADRLGWWRAFGEPNKGPQAGLQYRRFELRKFDHGPEWNPSKNPLSNRTRSMGVMRLDATTVDGFDEAISQLSSIEIVKRLGGHRVPGHF